MTLHRSHAMNGYVGLLTSKWRKQENSISNGHAPIFSKENAGHAVGRAVLIADQMRKNGFDENGSKIETNLLFYFAVYLVPTGYLDKLFGIF